jgi:hypothetical protein
MSKPQTTQLKWGGLNIQISEMAGSELYSKLPDHTAHIDFSLEDDGCGFYRPSLSICDNGIAIEIPIIDCTLDKNGHYANGTGYNHKVVKFSLSDLVYLEIASHWDIFEKFEIAKLAEEVLIELVDKLSAKSDELAQHAHKRTNS